MRDRVNDQPIEDGNTNQPAPWLRNRDRTQARPQEDGHCRIAQRHQYQLQAEVLAHKFTGLAGVGLKHDVQNALRELLPVNNVVAQRGERGEPQNNADNRRRCTYTLRKEQQRNQPQGTEQQGVAQAHGAAVAGDNNGDLQDGREVTDKEQGP